MNIYDVDLATFEEAVKTLPYQSNAFLYIYPNNGNSLPHLLMRDDKKKSVVNRSTNMNPIPAILATYDKAKVGKDIYICSNHKSMTYLKNAAMCFFKDVFGCLEHNLYRIRNEKEEKAYFKILSAFKMKKQFESYDRFQKYVDEEVRMQFIDCYRLLDFVNENGIRAMCIVQGSHAKVVEHLMSCNLINFSLSPLSVFEKEKIKDALPFITLPELPKFVKTVTQRKQVSIFA